MRKVRVLTSALLIILLGFAWLPNPGAAQSNTSAEGEISSGEDLLTEEELQTLVSPIALYPDTLLNQVLVASTYPLEVIKADQYREDHSETDPETFQSDIETKGWDASVTVLATAFPDVLSNMSDHIDWTDAMGTAMLAQDEDVMDAVQVMRAQADQAGNLESGEEQTVEVTKENNGEQTIIIQPADPQVVYVPQYNTDTVYVEDTSSNSNSNDVATAALLGFGSAILINEIFDDDDDWNDYWGCRNCGGWGGRPMYRDPDVDIDINGDVNIGNEIKKGRKGWKADEKRKKDAKRKVKKRQNKDGKARMPDRQPNRGDKMRKDLAKKSGTQDISGKGNREARSKAQRDAARVPERHKDAIDRTKPKKKANAKSSGKKNASNKSRKKDVAKSKSTKKAAAKPKSKSKTKARTAKKPVKKPKSASKSAMKKKAHAPRTKSASKRGKKAKGHKKKRKG